MRLFRGWLAPRVGPNGRAPDVRPPLAEPAKVSRQPIPFPEPAIPSYTCPTCEMTSYNPNDIREGYCGNCHWWTRDMGAPPGQGEAS